MDFGEFTMPDELSYHPKHCWVRKDPKEDNIVTVGFDDFGQNLAGRIKNIMLLEEGERVAFDRPLGTMSSGKWTGKLYSPVTGEVVEANPELEDDPSLINREPYGEGWLMKVRVEDPGVPIGLLTPGTPEFKAWLDGEMEEYMG